MSTHIIYGSHYGHAERYARWLGKEVPGSEVFDAGAYSPDAAATPNTLVYVGGNYAGSLYHMDKFVQAARAYPATTLVLLSVGMASASRTHEAEKLWHKNVPEELRERVQCFHARGGLDFSRLSTKHKVMMTAVRGFLTAKPHDKRHAEDQELLDTWGDDFDHVTREQIEPVLTALNVP